MKVPSGEELTKALDAVSETQKAVNAAAERNVEADRAAFHARRELEEARKASDKAWEALAALTGRGGKR